MTRKAAFGAIVGTGNLTHDSDLAKLLIRHVYRYDEDGNILPDTTVHFESKGAVKMLLMPYDDFTIAGERPTPKEFMTGDEFEELYNISQIKFNNGLVLSSLNSWEIITWARVSLDDDGRSLTTMDEILTLFAFVEFLRYNGRYTGNYGLVTQ